ncbi:hypothetical protein Gotur_027621, partial [Gossypium turneri]
QVEFLEELDLSETAITEPPSLIFQLENLKILSFNGCKGPSSKFRPNMPLMLPSLSSLSSLRKLKLRDCNLGEGDIPSDIFCLSSLTDLDLSELKSLPELLTSIARVCIDGCASLEVVASPSKVCNLLDLASIKAINCYRLAENINAFILQAFANSRQMFDVIIPGSEIPEWFSQQRGGSTIRIPLPLNIQNDSQWIGVASCCIFVNDDASRDKFINCRAVIHCRNSGQAGRNGSVFRDTDLRRVDASSWLFGKRFNQPITKDHLFLRYWSRDKLYPFSLEDKCGECEINNLWTIDCLDQECDELELSFTDPDVPCVKVKKCGVRMVNEKDLEDIKELHSHTTQCSPNLEDVHQHSAHNDGSIDSIAYSREHRYGNWLCMDPVINVIRRMWEVDSKGKFTVKKFVFSLDSEGSLVHQRCNASYCSHSRMMSPQEAQQANMRKAEGKRQTIEANLALRQSRTRVEVENEYKNVMDPYGDDGKSYINWCTQEGRTNSMPLMLPSLSSLSSLRELKLRDCNLREGDIPSDISCLSSLIDLDLIGNNFISIPASLTLLSKLWFLDLSNCSMCALGEAEIRGLSSLSYLKLRGSNFITIPLALTQLSRLQVLAFSNCTKLKSLPGLLTTIYGDRWLFFTSSSCKSIKSLTLLCPEVKSQNGLANKKVTLQLRYPFGKIVNGLELFLAAFIYCKNPRLIDRTGSLVGKRLNEPIMKDHLFLHYWSRDNLYSSSLEDKYGDCETSNLWATDCLDKKWDELEVSFIDPFGRSAKVKKCGVRIMYEKDLEEIKELQCQTTQSSPNFEHIYQHSAHYSHKTKT